MVKQEDQPIRFHKIKKNCLQHQKIMIFRSPKLLNKHVEGLETLQTFVMSLESEYCEYLEITSCFVVTYLHQENYLLPIA